MSGASSSGTSDAVRQRREQYRARRVRLEKAVQVLADAARSKTLRPSYARMNPAAQIKYNVFYFGKGEGAPRAVLRGPWLFVDAPGAALPDVVEEYTPDAGRRTHAGKFNGRVLLTSEDSLSAVASVIRALRAAARP